MSLRLAKKKIVSIGDNNKNYTSLIVNLLTFLAVYYIYNTAKWNSSYYFFNYMQSTAKCVFMTEINPSAIRGGK